MKTDMVKIFAKISLGASAVLLFVSISASQVFSADAKIYFRAPYSVTTGDEFVVEVWLDTVDNGINAIAGDVAAGEGLKVVDIMETEGLISLWISPPSISDDGRRVGFAGVIPGGLTGKGMLMKIVAKAENVRVGTTSGEASASITAANMEIRANDGEATLVPVSAEPWNIAIDPGKGTNKVKFEDDIPPESFDLTISSDPAIFDGQPFIAFKTEDKQSGMDHYEAAFILFESPGEGSWRIIENPYVLPEEAMGMKVLIKAVDRAGNERIAAIPAPGYYLRIFKYVTILVLILWALFFVPRRFLLLHSSR